MSRGARITRLALLAAGAGLLIYGLTQGGYQRLFNKAVMICMQCMGIG